MQPLDWSLLRKRNRGRLPHWEIPGMTVFLTFRLADSLPKEVVDRYHQERRYLERCLRDDPDDPDLRRERTRLYAKHIDRCLDSGLGACWLAKPEVGSMVMSARRHFDGDRYLLHAAVVMPNHVHTVVTLSPDEMLEGLNRTWKGYTAKRVRKLLGTEPPFWQDETYDHIVRNENEFDSIVRYVLADPIKAGLVGWPCVYEAPHG